MSRSRTHLRLRNLAVEHRFPADPPADVHSLAGRARLLCGPDGACRSSTAAKPSRHHYDAGKGRCNGALDGT